MQKDSADEPICRAARKTENSLMDVAGGRRGWDTWRITWRHTLAYVKLTANGNLLYNSGNSNGAQ